MSIQRFALAITNSSATTESSGSQTDAWNGRVYGIRIIPGTIPSTNTLSVFAGTTDKVVLSARTLTTDPATVYPRDRVIDSTNATTGFAGSTQARTIPVMHAVSTTEALQAVIAGTATSESTLNLEFFIQGGIG